MTRDPSLHCKKSTLMGILDGLLPDGSDIEGITNMILLTARSHSMSNRSLVVSSNQLQKKTDTILKASRNDAGTMAMMMLMVRRKLKHVGVRLIEPTSRDWAIVKTLTEQANQFCGEFELKKRDGYKQFLEIGLSMMGKFSMPKLTGMYESICETYSAIKEIQNDPTPEETENSHVYYRYKIAERTGIVNTYKNLPNKYVYFCRMTALAKSLGITTKLYIDAQFAMMEYRGSVPDPIQLIGDKAKERLNKYLYRQK